MYEIKDSDPLVRSRRPFNSVSGSEITVGNIAKISDSLAESRDTMSKLTAKLAATIADLERRIVVVEAETRARIAAAISGDETLAQRLARLNPRR
jgi:hypothetical protein